MEKAMLSESNFALWLLIGNISHSMTLLRQRELNEHNLPIRQLHIMVNILALGRKATLAEVAKQVERQIPVVSRQTISMEKDGFIKRIKDKPKSNLLRLELTEKGLNMIKVSRESKAIDAILSFLSEDERQQLNSIFNRIVVNVEEYYRAKYNETGFVQAREK